MQLINNVDLELYHDLEKWLAWIDELAEKDFVVIDEFFGPELYSEVRNFFISKLPAFQKAGIGAQDDNIIRHDIRGDHTYWLDRQRDASLQELWNLIDETIYIYNRYCYLSLSGSEFHFANYPPGSLYKKHLDQFNNRSNRMITVIVYLNKDWKKGDGGELEVFLKNNESIVIEPLEARCVMFKSADVPHQVLQSYKDRYSLTGWLLYHPSKLGQFF